MGVKDTATALQQLCLNLTIRRLAAAKPDFMTPETVSIRKWSAAYHGDESRTDWIQRLIVEEYERDPDAASGLYINTDGDLSLDERGIMHFSEILIDFFGDAEMLEVYRDFKTRNRMIRFYEDTERAAADLPPEKRKELLRVWKSYKPKDQDGATVRKNMLSIIRSAHNVKQ